MANLIRQRKAHLSGLGEAARSWGGSAVLGVPPMSNCRGLPHERLPWFPRGLQGADAGSAHSPSP
ncbi:MAG: hypothetical protein F6K26_42605 [Moorea sp. SIO2I5]|nr:hypothetical protein [Moorena sp. SIO2I5]